MSYPNSRITILALVVLLLPTVAAIAAAETTDGQPHLRRQGTASQLVVDGQPFLVLGGELHNSSSSSRAYMRPIWDRLVGQNLNTVIAGVSWELTEPVEGQFDFQNVDDLVADARAHHLHLVLLWFGSWKNSLSSYAPVWVKRDTRRFPRVQLANGNTPELLTPLSLATGDADARAFGAMMKHLHKIDAREHTVLMVQVENECGVLGDSRDRSPAAEAAFAGPVPAELLSHLVAHRGDLVPELRAQWESAGARTAGTWTEVFGAGVGTDELFMAWHYARYLDRVAAAGAAAHGIPLYANAWLNEPNAKPGDYPSGGPLAHLLNVWQAGAPHLALIAPDLYAADFADRCRLFSRSGNPLFMPETNRGEMVGRNLFVAVGAYDAIGFSPFGIDRVLPAPAIGSADGGDDQPVNYAVMAQIAPLVLAHQGMGTMTAFAVDKDHPKFASVLGGIELTVTLDELFGNRAEKGYGLIMAVGPDEFIGVGKGFRVAFKAPPGAARVGINFVDEGEFRNGQWIKGRRLNGDENDQGLGWRFNILGGPQIERCVLYRLE
jgi:beta-galactosidase GanA